MAIKSIRKALNRLPFRRRAKPTSPAMCGGGVITAAKNKDDEFRKVFNYLDANNDGKISANELRAYFESIGDAASHDEAERIIREFSGGGAAALESGGLLLGFEEFLRVMELHDDEVLREAFEVYVVDKGSGGITPEGLRQVLRRLGDVKTYRECEDMIRVFDLDGNGVLDFHEFHKMMS